MGVFLQGIALQLSTVLGDEDSWDDETEDDDAEIQRINKVLIHLEQELQDCIIFMFEQSLSQLTCTNLGLALRCSECQCFYANSSNLNRHMKSIHRTSKKALPYQRPIPCGEKKRTSSRRVRTFIVFSNDNHSFNFNFEYFISQTSKRHYWKKKLAKKHQGRSVS